MLQAGRKKRKVVAHPNDDYDDDENDDVRPFKKCPSRSRYRLLLVHFIKVFNDAQAKCILPDNCTLFLAVEVRRW